MFFKICVYLMVLFTFSITIHYILNYFYPPICNGCKNSGGAKTFWENLEHKKPPRKIDEEDEEMDADI